MIVPRPWRLGAALALTFLALGANLTASLAVREILTREFSGTVTSLLVGGCIVSANLLILGVVWRAASNAELSFAASVGLRRPLAPRVEWIGAALAGAFGARLFAWVYGVVVAAFRLQVPGMDVDQLSLFPAGTVSAVVLIATVVLIAPFAEEVAFRGVLLPALGARWGTAVAVVGSSLIFSAVHLNVFLFVPLLVASLVFGFLFVRFESLWPAYLCHAAFNGVAVAVTLMLGSGLV